MSALILAALSLLLPLLLAGVVLIAVLKRNWLGFLAKPIDGGLKLTGQPIFGPNKTWRGVAVYLVVGTSTVVVLHNLASVWTWISPLYAAQPLRLGMLWTGAYVAGELVNSFVKRRLRIGAGEKATTQAGRLLQKFFDNTDGSLATGVVLIGVYRAEIDQLLVAFALGMAVHAITEVLMRRLGLKPRG